MRSNNADDTRRVRLRQILEKKAKSKVNFGNFIWIISAERIILLEMPIGTVADTVPVA